jgi:hypothetical protein
MKKEELKNTASHKNLKEFYSNRSLQDLKRKDSETRIMQNQLFKVTGGKNIVISNKSH